MLLTARKTLDPAWYVSSKVGSHDPHNIKERPFSLRHFPITVWVPHTALEYRALSIVQLICGNSFFLGKRKFAIRDEYIQFLNTEEDLPPCLTWLTSFWLR